MSERLSRLRAALETVGLGCMLVTKMENVRYLSGFTGSSASALVTIGGSVLVTDGRYREQAAAEATGWDVIIHGGSMLQSVAGAVPAGKKVRLRGYQHLRFLQEAVRGGRQRAARASRRPDRGADG